MILQHLAYLLNENYVSSIVQDAGIYVPGKKLDDKKANNKWDIVIYL